MHLIRVSVALVAITLFGATASPKLDHSLIRTLSSSSTATANILISFQSKPDRDLKTVYNTRFKSRSERVHTVAEILRHKATSNQQSVISFLSSFHPPVPFEQFWISNQIYVKAANLTLVESLSKFDEIEVINEEEWIQLSSPLKEKEINCPASTTVEWNLNRVQAPDAWNLGYDGKGVVVANIDSGVRGTHSALRANYVGSQNHGWYDPYHETEEPNDQLGHGTHVMGTLAGRGGIGVAPGSTWLACKGCYCDLCGSSYLMKCGQFLLCPTLPDFSNPDCSKAPHVINCSWGGGRNNRAYHHVIDAWTAAGIMAVFSNGNTGPDCSTGRSPADYPKVIGVGATTPEDTVAEDSGLGPTVNNTVKPDFVAPGTCIRSATNSGDDDYEVWKGTSMAAPHVAGSIAVLKSAQPELDFNEAYALLSQGADQALNLPAKDCGGIAESEFPNNVGGHGIVNAYKSIEIFLNNFN